LNKVPCPARIASIDAGIVLSFTAREGVAFVQIKISARHGHLAEPTQQFIKDKAEKLLHLFSRLTTIDVTVDLKDEEKLVEFNVSAEHKHDFVASEHNKDILVAVDLALAKLEGQLRKYKEKIQEHRRRPPAGEVAGTPPSEDAGEE
jgi:putative sigma-54 modulation protein